MDTKRTLQQAYNEASYPLAGHGKRNADVLKAAFENIEGSLESDMYGKGAVIEGFQSKMAEILGKETAVFFPSGTMAQQIALRIWCDESGSSKVAYHPLCHLEIHEQNGIRELHRLEPIILADHTRPVLLQDLLTLPENVAAVLLELPQREIGGQLPSYGELEEMSAYCRARGIKLHMDGARLFEVLPFYGKTAQEVCALFDSVYISVYKGIGGIAGAVLAGEAGFAEQAKIWKRRHGGDLISLYPYIIAADFYMDQRLPRMSQYYREAVELSRYFNDCKGLETVPAVPVSNMFHVHASLSPEQLEPIMLRATEESGLGFAPSVRKNDNGGSYFEVSMGDRYSIIPKGVLRAGFEKLNRLLAERLSD